MILKEIEMDIPYPNNQENLTLGEKRTDYELNWKEKRRRFQLMTRCITSMIERLMPKVKTNDCWKILIECVEDAPNDFYKNLLGVYVVQIQFDINLFFGLNNYEKKKYTLLKIREAIGKISQWECFETEEINNICDMVENADYINEWYWQKPLKQKDNSVQIKVLHDVDKVYISMVFKKANVTIKEKILAQDIPDEWIYGKYFGKLEWISQGIAKLTTKDGKMYLESCE